MPLNRRADCNYKANGYWWSGAYVGAISFETTDNGYPTLDATPWTLAQLADLVRHPHQPRGVLRDRLHQPDTMG
jgi:hypothetical protein